VKTVLNLPVGAYEDLVAHLLPGDTANEQAAFLFVRMRVTDHAAALEMIESAKLADADFTVQAPDYLELADATRARLIKRAHDLDASLVEMHSHPGPWDAAFSPSDLRGLSETVPHMWWRLNKRPYAAIVVAPSGFDALVWLDGPVFPQELHSLAAGSRLLVPTNITIRARR
jgi:hypothetical protein